MERDVRRDVVLLADPSLAVRHDPGGNGKCAIREYAAVVRETGLEPARVAPLDPKSSDGFAQSQSLPRVAHGRERRGAHSGAEPSRTLRLVTTKRKPFDVFAERPILEDSRGNWRSFEPLIAAYVDAAISPCAETIVASRVMRLSA